MGFINDEGRQVSYECSDLIEELKQDIEEFGGNTIVAVWCKDDNGVVVYTNYDFIEEDAPIRPEELENGEYLREMTMTALLMMLEQQNRIF